jgi:hypothetical protein
MSLFSSSHVAKYVGDYVHTGDFAFQEEMRKLDLSVKSFVITQLGNAKADSLFVNGWSQVSTCSRGTPANMY